MTDADIRAVVVSVEIHAGSVHLLIALKGLGRLTGSNLTLDDVRARSGVGDQVIRDGARAHCARIVVPLRLKPRGGRTWNGSPEGAMLHELPAVSPAVVKRLRAAHKLLRRHNLSPDQDAHQFREGRSPVASRQVKMAQWAFLAPDIQRAIMKGEMSPQSAERLVAASALPLSWRRQRLALGMAGYKPTDGGQRVDGQLVYDALNSVA